MFLMLLIWLGFINYRTNITPFILLFQNMCKETKKKMKSFYTLIKIFIDIQYNIKFFYFCVAIELWIFVSMMEM